MRKRGKNLIPRFLRPEWLDSDSVKMPRSQRREQRSVDQKFGLGYVTFEMPVRHVSAAVERQVEV